MAFRPATPDTQTASTPMRGLDSSIGALAHSQQAVDKLRTDAQQANTDAQQAQSPMGIAGETAKGVIPTAIGGLVKSGKSVVQAVGEGMGAPSGNQQYTDMMGNTDQTYQADIEQGKSTVAGAAGHMALDAVSVYPAETILGKGAEMSAGPLSKVARPLVEGIGGVASKVAEKTGLSKFLAERADRKATEAIQSTAETMSTGEQEAAIREGRQKTGIRGGFAPSETETRAGNILSGKVGSNPAKNVSVVQSEIAKRGKEAEQFLGQNGRPVAPDEIDSAFQTMKDKASRYLSPDQIKNYDHTISQFHAELKDVAGKDPIAQNTGTYYKALKNFEQNVTARLRQGNEALLTDSGSAQLQAAKDVRTAVRDLIGQKHPEFKGKMYDLTSLYDALDNATTLARKADTFTKRFPKTAGALNYGLQAIGVGGLYETTKKMGVPLP